jgi:hypothetical protein
MIDCADTSQCNPHADVARSLLPPQTAELDVIKDVELRKAIQSPSKLSLKRIFQTLSGISIPISRAA